MVGIEVAGKRGERAVRHPHRDRRGVLERVRHRQQEDVHGGTPAGAFPFRPLEPIVAPIRGRPRAGGRSMTRDEMFALFTRRETAWRARDAASLTADHTPDGVVVSPTGGVLEGSSKSSASTASGSRHFPISCSRPRTCSSTRTAPHCSAGSPAATRASSSGCRRPDAASKSRAASSTGSKGGLIVHERRILDFTGLLVQVGVLRAKPAG